ncbi:flavodoxin family protein [Lactococcus lactis]|uniref:flavodoxin family protein n=1 Tax=Lactococcus lactis TaxID=1358 RepID=UPI0020692568|nr:NAD(P)H-dependent oxidoreductase [Lactococcus lactis]BDH82209.1 hypothetical protein LLL8_18660 [Lactococcus lactis]
MKKIYSFIGSRSTNGHTEFLAKQILEKISEEQEVDWEINTFNDITIDPYGKVTEEDGLEILKNKILNCDILLLGCPVYMHGIPGELKNAIDRLSDWAHTMRFRGKKVILVSTCSGNGHTTAIDTLHSYVLKFGGTVAGKIVTADNIPDIYDRDDIIMSLNNQINLNITQMINDIAIELDKPFRTNNFLESSFQIYKANYSKYIKEGWKTEETDYWIQSGMINCQSFQEWVDKK